VLGENQQKAIIDRNGFVNLLVDLLPALNIVWRKPTTDTFVLKVCIKAICEILIPCGVADEARSEDSRIMAVQG
jgi:hypothetical protein